MTVSASVVRGGVGNEDPDTAADSAVGSGVVGVGDLIGTDC